jgi:uncharacterized membrane protein YczE
MQFICKHDALGTYLTYGIAIMIAIIFGLLNDNITGIGIGTLITISFSGAMIRFFQQKSIKKYINDSHVIQFNSY